LKLPPTGVHPQIIVKSLRKAAQMSISKINEISVKITKQTDKKEQRQLLEKCAQTTLSSKLVAQHKEYFAKLVVDAVMLLDDLLPLNMIGIKKVSECFFF
jgi:T-complex protein 1 subunit eta